MLDIHDGETDADPGKPPDDHPPDPRWKADLVISPRPNDYHPDHRYTGVLVQDAAYMVTVPHFAPTRPHRRRTPSSSTIPTVQKPHPFQPDVVVRSIR